MHNAPLVVFVYNRIEHVRKALISLDQNTLASDTDLYIFSDAPTLGKSNDVENVAKVRDYIHSFKENSQFKSVHIFEKDEHKGLAASVISGVSEIISKYGKVIVVEDDLVCHQNFLNFMNNALNKYESYEKVWSISGHTRDLPILKTYPEDVYVAYRGDSWGWATWKDRWEKVDWEVTDYQEFLGNSFRKKQFIRGGKDLLQMLEDQRNGVVDSWAVRWNYAESKENCYTVYPKKTFVYNIGFDGSGTNCHTTANENYGDLSPILYTLPDTLTINKKLSKEFRDAEYMPIYKKAVRKLKRMMKAGSQ